MFYSKAIKCSFVFFCLFFLYACNGGSSSSPKTNGELLQLDRLNVVINGRGFFVLSDGGASLYKRPIKMGVDGFGFLVAEDGTQVQGYPTDNDGLVQTGVISDIQVSIAEIDSIRIAEDGLITGRVNGVRRTIAQLILADFLDPFGLQELSENTFIETAESGSPFINQPGFSDLGLLIVNEKVQPPLEGIVGFIRSMTHNYI